MPVIARTTTEDFSNNDQFTVQNVSDEIIILTDGHATMEIETADFTRHFNLAYCITCHAAQGSTFDHPYTIYELHKMGARLRYVALIRSTQFNYINMI
jgi:ATP-dependent exoDNAse (exonuclease V) alpha subunit